MKVSLKGLFNNVVSAMPKSQRDYYQFCLEEVYGHLEDVLNGKHTIEEFAEHYCIKKTEPETV
jgi:hypothetical protein